MAIKAIALDIDGTLTNDDKKITPRTREALLAAQASGIRLILASGRPERGLRAYARELDLERNHGMLVAFNGALVIDAQSNEVLFDEPMSAEDCCAVIDHMRDFDVTPWIVEGDQMYVEQGMPHMILHNGEPMDIVEFERYHLDLVLNEVPSLTEFCTRPQEKLLVAGTDTYLQEHWREMSAPFEDRLSSMFTADFYYEFMAPGIDKSVGLRHALPKCGIEPSELVAFGDGQNDVAMLSLAGTGVAMGNAVEEAKNVSDMVTGNNNEDGIAQALEKLLA